MGDLLVLLQALAILLTAVLAYRAIRGEAPNLRIVRADCVDGVDAWRGDSTVACHVRLFVVNLSGRGNAICLYVAGPGVRTRAACLYPLRRNSATTRVSVLRVPPQRRTQRYRR